MTYFCKTATEWHLQTASGLKRHLATKLTRLNLGLPIWQCACATSGGSRKAAPDYSAQGPRWDLGRIGWSPNGS